MRCLLSVVLLIIRNSFISRKKGEGVKGKINQGCGWKFVSDPQTGDNDYAFKMKHAQEFLKEGNKVRAYVFFKGRSILFKRTR